MTESKTGGQRAGLRPMNRKTFSLSGAWGLAVLIALLLAVLFVDSLELTDVPIIKPYIKHLIFIGLIYSILTLSLNFVTGYVGQVSLGHAAFFGLGGYISAILMIFLKLPFWVAFPIAGVMTGLSGIPLGLPALRVRGSFLVVVTYGFGEVMRFVAINLKKFGGPAGLPGVPSPSLWKSFNDFGPTGKEAFIIMAFLLALLLAVIMTRLERSPIGLAFSSIKEDEIAAGAMGISPPYYKLLAFVLSALFAGLAGSLYTSYVSYVSPEIFASNESILILAMVVVGGAASIRGAFLGAFALTLLPEILKWGKEVVGLSFDPWAAMFGFVLIIFMRVRSQGIWGRASLFRR